MRIVYLAPAQRDLVRLKKFLLSGRVTLAKTDEIILKTIETIRLLSDNPYLGFSFGGKYGFETPYRSLIINRYIAVYQVLPDSIEIRRIYSTKEDYLSELLPES